MVFEMECNVALCCKKVDIIPKTFLIYFNSIFYFYVET